MPPHTSKGEAVRRGGNCTARCSKRAVPKPNPISRRILGHASEILPPHRGRGSRGDPGATGRDAGTAARAALRSRPHMRGRIHRPAGAGGVRRGEIGDGREAVGLAHFGPA